MHTLLAVATIAFIVLGNAFFVWQMWRVGDKIDQAKRDLERDTARAYDLRLAA